MMLPHLSDLHRSFSVKRNERVLKMKKIFSLILAVVLISAFAVCCFAAPETAQAAPSQAAAANNLVKADDTVVENAFRQFAKLIDAESEARYSVANEAIFALYSVLKEAGVNDYMTLGTQMQKYAQDNESELAPIFSDITSVQIILRKFTVNGTFDINKVQNEIETSNSLASILSLYTGAYIVKSTTVTQAVEGQTTMVENPKTGESTVGMTAAIAVLALSAGAIAVCAKKKES